MRPEMQVRRQDLWQQGFLSSALQATKMGEGQRELLYCKIKHFSVNMCAVLLEQCYHCELNRPKGFRRRVGRGRKDGFNYLQG